MCSIVQLSVGGTRFEAPRATLCRVPGSFFDLLLGGDGDDGGARGGGGSFAAPADGVYRVNRAPTAFPLVLEYLRSGLGDMSWPDAAWQSQEMISAVGADAGFFMLEELQLFVLRLSLLRGWSGFLPRDLLVRDESDGDGVVQFENLALARSGPVVVSLALLRDCFPALHARVAAERASRASRTWEEGQVAKHLSFADFPRADALPAVLRLAALTRTAEPKSWALPRPAAHLHGFVFLSPARIEVQRLFDGAEEARLDAIG